MKILVWGVPCVGNYEIAELLAKKLNYNYFNHNYLIKEKYQTIDKFFEKFPNAYERFKEEENIAMNIIDNNENFVMAMSFIYIKEIVDSINSHNVIPIEITDNLESIYDRILFYDENDEVYSDSKEHRDKHKQHYMNEVKNDMRTSFLEFKDIPKFELNGRKFESVIDELVDFIYSL